MFWGLKFRSYLNVRYNVNVVGVTGMDISGTRAISAVELENYLTNNGVKLDMDSMWFGNEIRWGNTQFERIADILDKLMNCAGVPFQAWDPAELCTPTGTCTTPNATITRPATVLPVPA